MPFLNVEGSRLHYRVEGKPGLPALVLGNSLGTDLHMWHRQVEPLMLHFRLVRFDTRGHGASDVPPGDYSVDRLGRDVIALADHLGLDRFAYCGLSLGALVGQWLAVNAAPRLDALVLANGAAYLPSHESWSARMGLARAKGMGELLEMVMPRFFSAAYRERDEPLYHAIRNAFCATDPQGYAACCAAVRDADFRPRLKDMRVRTLVIGGSLDTATPADTYSAELAAGIAGARLATLEAGHISCVEQPEVFNRTLAEFLSSTHIR
jgi:3-oxoadipate enol-lactonase